MLASQVSALVATTVLAILIARALGPSEYGTFAGIYSLAQAVTIAAELGIATWLLRELSALSAEHGEEHEDHAGAAGHLLAPALALTQGVGLLLVVGTTTAVALLGYSTQLVVCIGALTLYMCQVSIADIVESVFRARRAMRLLATAVIGEKLLLLILVITVVALDGGIVLLAAAYATAGLARITFDLVAVLVRRYARLVRPRLPRLGAVVRRSLPFWGASTVVPALVRLDIFFVGLFSTTSAAYYTVGDRWVTGLQVLSTTAGITLYPHLARRRDVARVTRRASLMLGAVGVVLTLVSVLIAPAVVPALFGERYSGAVPVVQVMVVAAPWIYGAYMYFVGLNSVRRERSVFVATLLGTVVGTGLVLVGMAAFGVIGAAVAYVVRFALTYAAVRGTARYHGFKRLVQPQVSGGGH